MITRATSHDVNDPAMPRENVNTRRLPTKGGATMKDEVTATSDRAGTLSSLELRSVHEEIEAIKEQTASVISGLTEDKLVWRPAPNVWSIADCLAHLNVTGDLYTTAIRDSIKSARAAGLTGAGAFRHGWLGNLFVWTLEPPVRFRLPAPKVFLPAPSQSAREVVEKFMRMQDEVQTLLREADGIDLGRAKVASPVNARLKLSLGQAFRLVTAHERRHLWQARKVRERVNFPG